MYKIRKRNEKISINTKPGYLLHPKWAFYPQLCIYRFLVLRGYSEHFYVSVSLFRSCLLLTQLVVIVEKQLAPWKPFVRTHCPPRTVGEANAPLPNALPRETTRRKLRPARKAGATHSQSREWPRISSHSLIESSLSNCWPQNSY